MALENEQSTYVRELPSLLASEGKFVLVAGDAVVGIYDSYADAIKIGYEKFGLGPFMVKQISAVQRTHRFTRDLSKCPT